MSGVALVQHGLEFALVVAIDASPEQMRRPIGAANLDAQLTGALDGAERLKTTSVASSIWAML